MIEQTTFQVNETPDLKLAFRLGQRLVVNHLHLTAYRTPGHFPSRPAWRSHRRLPTNSAYPAARHSSAMQV